MTARRWASLASGQGPRLPPVQLDSGRGQSDLISALAGALVVAAALAKYIHYRTH